jgi:glycosyltransferase involved in cell wall biosynthesis
VNPGNAAGREDARYRFGFVMEYTIGHVTFVKAMQRAVAEDPTVEAEWYLVEPAGSGFPATLPPISRNYTLRTSATARRLVGRGPDLDALFMHTQTLGLFFLRVLRRLPTVISADATPRNMDEIGAAYRHEQGGQLAEELKRRLMCAILQRAAAVMPWSDWARCSMIEDYGVAPERCHLVRPGVDVAFWGARRSGGHAGAGSPEGAGSQTGPGALPGGRVPGEGRPLRLVFVGGDFSRKGGGDLLAAVAALREEGRSVECDVVTKSRVPATPGVRAHRDLSPGDPALRDLVAAADVFVLPSRADALGWAIVEAMAAGVAVVSTRSGAIPEVVREGRTGLLVSPGDRSALVGALRALADDPSLCRRMGAEGARVAAEEFDLSTNGRSVLDLLKSVASPARPGGVPARAQRPRD